MVPDDSRESRYCKCANRYALPIWAWQPLENCPKLQHEFLPKHPDFLRPPATCFLRARSRQDDRPLAPPPTMTDEQVQAGLAVARRCACVTACVKPYSVPMAAGALAGSGVGVCAVADFRMATAIRRSRSPKRNGPLRKAPPRLMSCQYRQSPRRDWSYVSAEIKAVTPPAWSAGHAQGDLRE